MRPRPKRKSVTAGYEGAMRLQPESRLVEGDASMRFIRKCLMAASYGLVFLGAAQAQSVNNGVTAVLPTADSQNANVLSAQMVGLKTTQTIQSLSFYVTAASGNLILGLYDATGPSGGPGALKASSASFTPKTGWNTAKVATPVSLAAGNYWIAFLPSSNALGFRVQRPALGYCRYYSYAFGALPGRFSASPVNCSPQLWSLYARLTTTTSAVNGACGASNGATASAKPTANLCTAGTASAVAGSGPWSWSCAGSNGGSTATCSDKLASTAVNGACGSSNGATASAKPTANLCTAGTASAVAGSGPWSWSCAGSNGGSTATCSDKLASTAVNGACGSSNGATASAKPTANLCTAGTASAVAGSGPWSWSCAGSGGGTNATCSDKLASTAVNGACGASNGASLSSAPTANLCTAGTASAVSGAGPWSWSCGGANGGSTATCVATKTASTGADPTNGVLPAYDDAYANWKNAGLQSVGGIPNRTTVCATVNPLGGGQDDFTNIQNAINTCPAGQVVQLGAGAFTVHMADLPIQVSTGVVLRGTGACAGSSSPYCQTSITVSDGALAYTGGMCGAGASSKSACPNGGPPAILVGPVSPDYNYSWAQCGNIGSVVGTGCGAATLGADAVQGQTTIQVSSTSGFSVGQWVLIDEASGAGWVADPLNATTGYGSVWAASDWLSPSGSPATGRVLWPRAQSGGGWDFGSSYPYQAGSVGCWFSYCDRPTQELHEIASIGAGPCPGTGCTLTFDDPLTVAFRQSGGHNAQVYAPYPNQSGTGSPLSFLQNAGVENISVLRAVNGGLEMEFCAYCWVKNVEVGDWYGGGINIERSVRSEFNGVYVHHCWDSVNNGGEYPIALDSASTEILITNSITNFAGKGMVARAGGAGSVVSYNYQDDTMYDAESGIGDYWIDMGLNASHYSGPHHILFEGNWGDNLDNDHTHGNSTYITFFRNQGSGLRSPFTDPSVGKAVNDYQGTGYA